MITDINSEDRLVQQTFAAHLETALGWESVYAYNAETFGPNGTLGRTSERDVVLVRDLRAALERLNPDLPAKAREQAIEKLTRIDFARSLVQHNREFYGFIRTGVPVEWRDVAGETRYARAQVIDFRSVGNNRFLAVRELKIQGVRVPHYNRRGDLICFVNGLPLVFIELKAVYRNIRAGFDDNLTDYLSEHSIAHAFHHNAFLVVSNGDQARYGSITSKWEHFVEWKRNAERDMGRVDAEALLDGMLAKERLLDLVESFILLDDSRAGGTRKIVARNHQVLGVNNAVAAVRRQEELKRLFPPKQRLVSYTIPKSERLLAAEVGGALSDDAERFLVESDSHDDLPLVERAHPDLGRLGVFWHTQGSGKSYSMAFFAEKVRMDYYKRYQEIIADYNREKDRVTVEATFAQLVEFASSLDGEQRRAADEGLSDAELALFDLLFKDTISKADRERLKQASKGLLVSLRDLLRPMHDWTQNTTTQAEVKVFILDNLWRALPRPPFTDEETEAVATRVYDFVWQQSASGHDLAAAYVAASEQMPSQGSAS
jgi:type I site-specific restriction-modification system R (restriction) subunit